MQLRQQKYWPIFFVCLRLYLLDNKTPLSSTWKIFNNVWLKTGQLEKKERLITGAYSGYKKHPHVATKAVYSSTPKLNDTVEANFVICCSTSIKYSLCNSPKTFARFFVLFYQILSAWPMGYTTLTLHNCNQALIYICINMWSVFTWHLIRQRYLNSAHSVKLLPVAFAVWAGRMRRSRATP